MIDTVVPSLFTFVTAVVLSILISTVMLFHSLTKHFTAWKAARASRQLISRGHLFVTLYKVLPNLKLRHLTLPPVRVSLS